MLRDVFLDTAWACGAITILAITTAIVKTAHDYVRGRLFRPRTQVFVNRAETVSTGSTGAAVIQPIRSPDVAESVFPPVTHDNLVSTPAPVKTPEDFVLECGNCRKQIKSTPVKMQAMGAGKTELRYRCEHCGAMVAVKV